MTPLVSVRGVGWRAGRREILSGVSADIGAGELVALVGRNGAGKSTLMDLMAGLRPPSEGRITIDGRGLAEWRAPDLARVLAHLPQVVRADLNGSAGQLVLMGRYPHATGWLETDDDRREAVDAMVRCDCLQFRDRSVATLSGGERQRVLLAACLAQRPRLLLLDEPATFLDIDQQIHCFEVLREEVNRGAACVAVTHDLNLALTFCTRVIVLAGGVLAADLPVSRALDDRRWLDQFSPRLVRDGDARRPAVGVVRVNGPETARSRRWLVGSALAFVAAAALLPLAGPAGLDLAAVRARQEPDWSILVHLRLSRTLLGLFAGGALALAGALFQAMLRDALATPYTLGVSTGASLGAVIAIAMGWHLVAGIPGVWAGALAGAALVLVLVVSAATRERRMSPFGLLLAGVATNSVCAALILLIHGLSGLSQSFAISHWLIGGLDAIEYTTPGALCRVGLGRGGRGRVPGAALESPGGRRSVGSHARRQHPATHGRRLRRRIRSRGRHRRPDGPDRVRRARRPARAPLARERRRSRPDAVRVPARRRAPGGVRHPGPRRARASGSPGRRHHRHCRRAVSRLARAKG